MDMSACCSCVLVSRQTSTPAGHTGWHWSQSQPLTEDTKPTSVPAARFGNCGASQYLSPFLSSASLGESQQGSNPRNEVTCEFFSCIFWLDNRVRAPRASRKVAFGTRTAESQPSHTASHFFNGRKACGVQTALSIHYQTIRTHIYR